MSNASKRADFIAEIYDNINDHIGDCPYFLARGIGAPKVESTMQINADVGKMYNVAATRPPMVSADRSGDEDDPLDVPDEVLNECQPSGMPPHKLYLKDDMPVILLRNVDSPAGACNGARLMIRSLSKNLIDAELMSGKNAGNRVYIPRMDLTPAKNLYAFQLHRRQFPVLPAFGMTINKSQGQSFEKFGIYLPKPVFAHGQLYVALSRVGALKDIRLFIEGEDDQGHCMNTKEGTFTRNIVYREMFDDPEPEFDAHDTIGEAHPESERFGQDPALADESMPVGPDEVPPLVSSDNQSEE